MADEAVRIDDVRAECAEAPATRLELLSEEAHTPPPRAEKHAAFAVTVAEEMPADDSIPALVDEVRFSSAAFRVPQKFLDE